ncbi:MAG: Asp-tRNA(Asn)/Glu-tRNA(Gln) amidotransferase subunit GatC [Alphaproteobacteria bacterium]|nr:MAG: Asp-tRNA(Asn)/Glu-tRNA(Gln) amidotransferase subunit GatC [Alphaproteobacteria bacterium]
MSIDEATARRVAHLARIRLSEEEVAPFAQEISGILGWIEQLQEVDVEGVEPMSAVMPMPLKRRPDIVTDGGIREDVLANAPETREGFFVVPKVVE